MSLEAALEDFVFHNNIRKLKLDSTVAAIKQHAKELGAALTTPQIGRYFSQFTQDTSVEEVLGAVQLACERSVGRHWDILGEPYTWNLIPRDVQIKAGAVLSTTDEHRFIRARTGEGKTLMSLFPIVYHSLFGQVHVMTANNYLAERDHAWLAPVLSVLGIESAYLARDEEEKYAAYDARVVFGSYQEFGFDLLKDSVRSPASERYCKQRATALIDEADLIMIDELETPLLLSADTEGDTDPAHIADGIVRDLVEKQGREVDALKEAVSENAYAAKKDRLRDLARLRNSGLADGWLKEFYTQHPKLESKARSFEGYYLKKKEFFKHIGSVLYYVVNKEHKTAMFTERGMDAIEQKAPDDIFKTRSFIDEKKAIENDTRSAVYKKAALRELKNSLFVQDNIVAALNNALHAHTILQRDKDYIVTNDETIELISTATGRADPIKKYQRGVSQAVECKEEVPVTGLGITITGTTIPGFLREYDRLHAMSGTISPNQKEIKRIYAMECYDVPPHVPSRARHARTHVLESKEKKDGAILEDILEKHAQGRPILIGTQSVKTSERLVALLNEHGLDCEVLTAKNEAAEAAIIARAGEYAAITIATQMAGRGTDIAVSDETNQMIAGTYVSNLRERLEDFMTLKIATYSQEDAARLIRACEGAGIFVAGSKCKKETHSITIKGNGRGKHSDDFITGMHVIGAELGKSRRVNNQLRGRTGRQGATGTSIFYTSLEDAIIANTPSKGVIGRLSKRLLLKEAQDTSEQKAATERQKQLFYGSLIEEQRKIHATFRETALQATHDAHTIIEEVIDTHTKIFTQTYLSHEELDQFIYHIEDIFNTSLGAHMEQMRGYTEVHEYGDAIKGIVKTHVFDLYKKRAAAFDDYAEREQNTFLHTIDSHWIEYMDTQGTLRSGAQLSAYAQKKPEVSYIKIAHDAYTTHRAGMLEECVRSLFTMPLPREDVRPGKKADTISPELAELLG